MTPDPTPRFEQTTDHAPSRPESRGVPAEVQYLIIVLALFGLLLVSGVPGAEVPEAGDGTGVLRKGWAEKWTAEVEALQQAAAGESPAVQGR